MGNLSLGFWAIAFLLLGSLIDAADGSIHEYKNQSFTKIANARYFYGGNEGLYASEFLDVRASSATPPLKGKSFIRFDDISFVRSKESASKQNSTQATAGLVEAILFEVKQQDRVGGSFFKTESFCCTPRLADDGSCKLGQVLISADPNAPEFPKRIPTIFKRNQEEVKMLPETVVINKTGWYIVYFMTCDPELDGITIKGKTIWKNPEGYLQGQKAPFMKFYASMFWAYVLLCLAWFPGFVQHWNHRIQLHSYITLVIVLAMCESALRYLEFTSVNSTGISSVDVTFWAVTFSSLKMTLSRLLLLVISTGYGVVKPIIDGIAWRMLLLGILCFLLAEVLGLAEHLGYFSEKGLTPVMVCWAIVESLFVRWIFRSLWKTLKKLKVKTNMAKLRFYRMFATALVFLVFVNIALIYVMMHFNTLSGDWQVEWIIPASWHILDYALLLLICLFWPPSDEPTRYLYLAEMDDKFEEEDLLLAEAGMKATDNNVENDERKSLLDGCILLFGNLPGER